MSNWILTVVAGVLLAGSAALAPSSMSAADVAAVPAGADSGCIPLNCW